MEPEVESETDPDAPVLVARGALDPVRDLQRVLRGAGIACELVGVPDAHGKT